ncbi:hypothetical protein J5U18_13165 [Sphingobacteriaceae bacterium WQ 2009]|uniref:Uncharacterized protein n=1 Tax=Rhinopithecimicrobium faecis TaxID=2820698 RepID=A0A8T4HC08_9SPHI|nr:hypothetical protein [Sphingobacteriaceae bacterium WQ 2009]
MKNLKLVYLKPLIVKYNIELENGIAANSAKVNIGSPLNEQTPQVELWKNKGSEDYDFDMM